MTSHVMCDLETLDTRPSAIIMSIGACTMDPITGQVENPFYNVVDVESCKRAGLTQSDSTVAWWEKQSEEARAIFSDSNRVSLIQALSNFSNYLRLLPGGPGNVRIYGNGSDFDNVILSNAFSALGYEAPWKFYNNRCYRTIVNTVFPENAVLPARKGTHHNALDDAVHQANVLLSHREFIRWK